MQKRNVMQEEKFAKEECHTVGKICKRRMDNRR